MSRAALIAGTVVSSVVVLPEAKKASNPSANSISPTKSGGRPR